MTLYRCSAVAALSAAVLLAVLPANALAEIVHVDAAAKSGGNGSSWKKAFRSLQKALQVAQPGDEIRIARGTYRPAGKSGPRTASFAVPDGVVVQGGYAGVRSGNPNKLKPSKYRTILSGDLKTNDGTSPNPPLSKLKDNVYHVVTFENATSATTLAGVTITGGHANSTNFDSHKSHGGGVRVINTTGNIGQGPTIQNCRIRGNFAMWSGAGLYAPQASPTILDSSIRGNTVPSSGAGGAGILIAGGLVENCTFKNNDAGIASAVGGAIRAHSATITNCTFKQNGSSAIHCSDNSQVRSSVFFRNTSEDGGAIAIAGQNIGIIDCGFESNEASSFGGAIYAVPSSSAQVINCDFFMNAALDGNAVANRGELVLINCVLVGNRMPSSIGGRGALYNHSGALDLINCTIAHNTFEDGPGAGLFNDSGASTITNSILWGNVGQLPGEEAQLYATGGMITIESSCVQGWTGSLGGSGNAGSNPKFIDANGDDNIPGTPDDNLRLQSDSPCKDSADVAALPHDAFDIDGDGDVNEPIPLDADQANRISGGMLDRGAFES